MVLLTLICKSENEPKKSPSIDWVKLPCSSALITFETSFTGVEIVSNISFIPVLRVFIKPVYFSVFRRSSKFPSDDA